MPLPSTQLVHPKLLDHIRKLHTNELPDVCTITRPVAASTAADGSLITGTATTVYSGACRAWRKEQTNRIIDVSGDRMTLRSIQVIIEWSVTNVQVDDVVTITSSADPRLVGRPLRIVAIEHSSYVPVRTLHCEDIQG